MSRQPLLTSGDGQRVSGPGAQSLSPGGVSTMVLILHWGNDPHALIQGG